MQYIKVGVICATHGLKGELSIKELTAFGEERFKKGAKLYIRTNREYVPLQVASMRRHKGRLLVSFAGYADINLVEGWKKALLYIKEEDVAPLSEDEAYYWQLKECKVYDEAGAVGEVKELIETGAQVVLRIRFEEEELRVPFVKVFFPKIDIPSRKLYLNRMEGLS